ncbi:glyoxalase [Pelobium manganitolerans]|uniref:Glyoxalase n=1 Tax=Pelobium manganitolerans TaxID=1842495 RepID=A0A419S3P1_9SPHI|nr:VOC family protein [Pelobium manganitolerans]RKD14280.1 glyoxalase [Pelobium manganitolerans]
MTTVNVYLVFAGNCEEAFNFYKAALGGEFAAFSRFGDMPSQEGVPQLSAAVQQRIMHVSLPISKETVLMGSDDMPGMSPPLQVGNNFSVSLGVGSKAKAKELFANLSEGGRVTMPLADTFWGSYFGMWTDKFGINWMINHDLLNQ